ncbi:MAG: hypothetical protein AAF307_04065 [Pseudomonadota bacterium]
MSRFWVMVVGMLLFTGGAVQARCAGFSDPPPLAAVEQLKEGLRQAEYEDTLRAFNLHEKGLERFILSLSQALPGKAISCTTLVRSRPSPNALSEVFTLQSPNGYIYFIVSGIVSGSDFIMLDIHFTGEFEKIRGLLY